MTHGHVGGDNEHHVPSWEEILQEEMWMEEYINECIAYAERTEDETA